jgi:hypothetical protein
MSLTALPLLPTLRQGPWTDVTVTFVGPAGISEPQHISNVYPFISVNDFKRLLWVHHDGDSRWAPERVFLGARAPDGSIRPLEFYWPTYGSESLPDPITTRQPTSMLVDEVGNRKPISPVMTGSLILEEALALEINRNATLPPLVAICLAALQPESEEQLTGPLYGGFYQLYFPWLMNPGQVLEATRSTDLKEAYESVRIYSRDRSKRIQAVDAALGAKVGGAGVTMTSMVRIQWKLPLPSTQPESLEEVFYSLKATETVPFIRYFPQGSTSTPLLKVALKPDGQPYIEDDRTFTLYLSRPAPTANSAVVLAVIPLQTSVAGRGTAFTLYMFEQGCSIIKLEVPQRGSTYLSIVAREAEEALARILPELGFEPRIELLDIHATYRWVHPDSRRSTPLSAARIQRRVDILTPFLEMPATKRDPDDKSIALFHWRAVSNYESETARFAYITQMVLRGGGMEEGTAALVAYTKELVEQFGITADEAAALLERWAERRNTAVAPAATPEAACLAVAKHSTGAIIALGGSHPEYSIEVQNVSSIMELGRIMSIMGVLLGSPAGGLPIDEPKAQVTASSNAVTLADAMTTNNAEAEGGVNTEADLAALDIDPAMLALMEDLGIGGDEVLADEMEEGVVVSTGGEEQLPTISTSNAVGPSSLPDIDRIAEEEGECQPNPWRPDESALRLEADWYVDKLRKEDELMFGSWKVTGQQPTGSTAAGRDKTYSRSCNRTDHRQPNVLTLAGYSRVRRCYEGKVRFVDLPPKKPTDLPRDLKEEAAFFAAQPKNKKRDVAVQEYLRKKADEDFLRDKETGQPLWIVYGYESKTRPGEFLYLTCSELWCVRDNMPLLRDEFMATTGRGGLPKEAGSCPFCGGLPIADMSKPVVGESVIVRQPKKSTKKIHSFIGAVTSTRHPNGWMLPCCDTTPRLLKKYLSAALTDRLEPGRELAPDVEEEGEPDAEKAALADVPQPPPSTTGDVAEIQIDYTQRLGSMHTQYILSSDKRVLEAGKIGLLTPALDAFFGQNGPASIETRGIRPTFKKGKPLFVRVGVDSRITAPGLNLFAALAPLYALKSATEMRDFFVNQIKSPTNPEQTKAAISAFIGANYGTLVSEFAARSLKTDKDFDAEIATFAQTNRLDLIRNRPHILRIMKARDAFVDYIMNPAQPKQLRHFEHMLAYPSSMSPGQKGIMFVVVDSKGQVTCPSFGIPPSDLYKDRPVAFLTHERRDESWEPIVLYNGTSTATMFFTNTLTEPVSIATEHRAAIRRWIDAWLSTSQGCRRPAPPPHVWTFGNGADPTMLPRLRELILGTGRYRVTSLVRDRSNRLVGVMLELKTAPGTAVFVPCLDDGSLVNRATIYEYDAISPAPIETYLATYRTLAGTPDNYTGLVPSSFVIEDNGSVVGFKIAAGTYIASVTVTSTLDLDMPTVKIAEFDSPWTIDAATIKDPTAPVQLASGAEELMASPAEQMDEAYQYVRLAMSRWMVRGAAGQRLRKDVLNIMNLKMPPYERRKRMDILLGPTITSWLSVDEDAPPTSLSLFRRDCLTLSDVDCQAAAACRYDATKGQCLIHAPKTADRDPVIIFTARMSDEILRFAPLRDEILNNDVETIRAPRGLVRVGSELYMATHPSDSAATILSRMGLREKTLLTFPEELLSLASLRAEEEMEPLRIPEAAAPLPPAWITAGMKVIKPQEGDEMPQMTAFQLGTKRLMTEWMKLIPAKRQALGLPGDPNRSFAWSNQDMFVIAALQDAHQMFLMPTPTGSVTVTRHIAPPNVATQRYMFYWGPSMLLITGSRGETFRPDEMPDELRALIDASSPLPDEEVRGIVDSSSSDSTTGSSDSTSASSSDSTSASSNTKTSSSSESMPGLEKASDQEQMSSDKPPTTAPTMENNTMPPPQTALNIDGSPAASPSIMENID